MRKIKWDHKSKAYILQDVLKSYHLHEDPSIHKDDNRNYQPELKGYQEWDSEIQQWHQIEQAQHNHLVDDQKWKEKDQQVTETGTEVIAMYTNICYITPIKSIDNTSMQFDTDSVPIRIDNCASRTMSFCKDDFISDTLRQVSNKAVKGFGNTLTPITHEGTLRWYIPTDQNTISSIDIPNSYYVPGGTSRLLSPQHWAQQSKDHYPHQRGTWCATYDTEVVLYWKQRSLSKTIKLDPSSTNVATIWTAPGYQRYKEFGISEFASVKDIAFDTQISIDEVTPFPFDPFLDSDGIPIKPADLYQPSKLNEFHEFLNGPTMPIPEMDKASFKMQPSEQKFQKASTSTNKNKQISKDKPDAPHYQIIVQQLSKLVEQLQMTSSPMIIPETMPLQSDPHPQITNVNDPK